MIMPHNRNQNIGYHPDMDAKSHEETYNGFVEFATIGTFVSLSWVMALALGGIKHAWGFAILAVVLSTLAGGTGLFSRSMSWKPSAFVFGLLLALFVIS
jgi:hypothetical protein